MSKQEPEYYDLYGSQQIVHSTFSCATYLVAWISTWTLVEALPQLLLAAEAQRLQKRLDC
jgi:hypothetical protein